MRSRRFEKNAGILLFLIALLGAVAACGGAEEALVFTEAPIQRTEEPDEEASSPIKATAETPVDPVAKALAEIDAELRNTMPGNIAHNAPSDMGLEESTEIALLVSPSVSSDSLATRITGSGEVIAGVINVTPWMLAELISPDPQAFSITPLHGDAQQPLSTVEPTEWKWLVVAEEEGSQRLILTVSRLVEVEGRESWRLVEEYRYPIAVSVTIEKRLEKLIAGMWDLKWWVGGILFPIVAYWIIKRLD